MKDLNGCYCEFNYTNVKALIQDKNIESVVIYTMKHIKIENNIASSCSESETTLLKKVHFVRGNFIGVEPKEPPSIKLDIDFPEGVFNSKEKKDHFAKFGFEVPEFECEIFKKIGKYSFGYFKTTDWNDNECISASWDENGNINFDMFDEAICQDIGNKYPLSPLKKEGAFPCIIRTTDGEVVYDIAVSFDNGCFVFYDTQRTLPNKWRLATNEEIDALKK